MFTAIVACRLLIYISLVEKKKKKAKGGQLGKMNYIKILITRSCRNGDIVFINKKVSAEKITGAEKLHYKYQL